MTPCCFQRSHLKSLKLNVNSKCIKRIAFTSKYVLLVQRCNLILYIFLATSSEQIEALFSKSTNAGRRDATTVGLNGPLMKWPLFFDKGHIKIWNGLLCSNTRTRTSCWSPLPLSLVLFSKRVSWWHTKTTATTSQRPRLIWPLIERGVAFHEKIQQVQTFAWTFLHLFEHWSVANVIFMCKSLCFWLPSEEVDKNSIYQNLLFFGEEKENAKKRGHT